MMKKYKKIIKILQEIKDMPKITIVMQGKEHKDMFKYFRKRHPRYWIIKNKQIGVALIDLPQDYNDYKKGKAKQVMRTNVNKCNKKGYYFKKFSTSEYIEMIMEINQSEIIRQGRTMSENYTNYEIFSKYLEKKPFLYGVFNSKDKLVAYIDIVTTGELAIMPRLLGHKDFIEDGIMYMLISEVVKILIETKQETGVKYLMYDTFFGANEGLAYFKKKLGFQPYNVTWKWKP